MNSDRPAGTVYFDGFCGLCDRFVNLLLARDTHRRLRFAPLQGETAASRLGELARAQEPETVVYENGDGIHVRSTAAILAMAALGGGWRFVHVLRVVPRPLRDVVYDWVARNRFRWFPRRESCRLPTAEERGAFLP